MHGITTTNITLHNITVHSILYTMGIIQHPLSHNIRALLLEHPYFAIKAPLPTPHVEIHTNTNIQHPNEGISTSRPEINSIAENTH